MLDQYGGPASDQARARTLEDFKTNRYQAATGTLVFSAAQVHAYQTLRDHYQAFFANPTTENGLRPSAIADPEQIRQLTSFFTWSAWAAAAQRPGQTYSYTNNWPPEPLVGNSTDGRQPGLERAVADRLAGRHRPAVRRVRPLGRARVARPRAAGTEVLPARRGGADAGPAHDRVVLPGYGRHCSWCRRCSAPRRSTIAPTCPGSSASIWRAGFPYNLTRTWHVQLSILWVATAFLAAGIFLAPMIAGREPRGQHWLAYGLLGALVLVVVGQHAR